MVEVWRQRATFQGVAFLLCYFRHYSTLVIFCSFHCLRPRLYTLVATKSNKLLDPAFYTPYSNQSLVFRFGQQVFPPILSALALLPEYPLAPFVALTFVSELIYLVSRYVDHLKNVHSKL